MKMAPNNNGYLVNANGEPVSRTYQYRKVMKPMLERKRRARINRCLDELKEIMTSAFQTEGENVSKLEKADILELTVRHLHNLRRQNQLAVRPEQTYADRFKAGFRTCASEVSHFLGGFDQQTNGFLIKHLNECINRFDVPCERKPEGFVHPSDPILNKPAAVNYHPHHHSQQPLNGLTGGDSHRYSPESQGNHYGNYHHDLSTVTPPLSPHIVVDNGIVWRPWLSSITKS